MNAPHPAWRRRALGVGCALALLLLGAPTLRAQEADAAAVAGDLAPATTDEPPFPPLPIEGEAPVPADEAGEPAVAPSEDDAAATAPSPARSDESATRLDSQAPERPTPRYVQPPPVPPSPAEAQASARPVPDDVKHARGISMMMLQVPVGALWGAAVAGTGLMTASAVLASPGLNMWPLGGVLAIAPLAVSLAGGGVAVLVNLGTAAVVDLLSGHAAPDGTAGKLLLWSGLYAGMVAVVAGLPLALPVGLAASGLFSADEVSNLLAYTLVASLIPVAVAPLAMLEAANEAGYSADLPTWCWHAMSICSFGTYVFF